MFDADLISKLPFTAQLNLALLMETPLSDVDKEYVEKLKKLLDTLKVADFRSIPFGRGTGFYLDRIEQQINSLIYYIKKPEETQKTVNTFAIEPNGLLRFEKLVKKHADKIYFSNTMMILQPTGHAVEIFIPALQKPEWQNFKGYLPKALKIIDDFLSSPLYKPLEQITTGMRELGANPHHWHPHFARLIDYVAKTDTSSIYFQDLDYNGPVLVLPPGWHFGAIDDALPSIKQVEHTSSIRCHSDILGYIGADGGTLEHAGEIFDTIDIIYYVARQLMSSASIGHLHTVIDNIACLGGGKISYEITVSDNTVGQKEIKPAVINVHSDQITNVKAIFNLIVDSIYAQRQQIIQQ